jgi:hypothetical protein
MNWSTWVKGAVALVISVTIFDYLFWGQFLGTNLVIYVLFIGGTSVLLNGLIKPNARQLAAFSSTLFTGFMYFFNGTDPAAVMLVISTLVFTVLLKEKEIRSITSIVPQVFLETVWLPWRLKAVIDVPVRKAGIPACVWRWTKLGLIPLVIFAVYSGIYRNANPRFNELTAGLFDGISGSIRGFLQHLFTAHTLFLLLGLLVAAVLLFRSASNELIAWESKFGDRMKRYRVPRPSLKKAGALNALEKERRAGIILLVMMNLLLLLVNIVDVSWIWTGFTVPENFDLKQFVHEGTWLLILSILMSIGILLYLFRRNQNFHPKRKALQILAVLWLAQNFILGISVFIRNIHYMEFHGLAHKRIGVVIFLVLVMFGLFSMVRKVLERRTGFNLVVHNSWAAFLVLVVASGVDWDTYILEKNLAHGNPAEIDIDLYLELDERTIPLVYANLDRIAVQMEKHQANSVKWVSYLDIQEFKRALDVRASRFKSFYESTDFRSHTLDMHRTYQFLKGQT